MLMRTLPLLALMLVWLGGCDYYRTSMDAVPDRGGHAYQVGAPGGSARPPPAASRDPAPVASDNQVVVEPGQHLYAIAAQHNVPLDDLIRVNDITSRPVPAGTVLVLPTR
ncbi:MAG: LysM peptidoglycan-binding domain-containing protein [Planctomycetota bacterium]